jgi:outer membrane protein assembly factor BamA
VSRIGVLIVLAVACAGPAAAQQTREEQRAAQQAEKAKNLHLYVPGPVEKYAARIEQSFTNPPPVYAYIGSIYPGGAVALGPGARYRFTSGAFADVHGAWSIKNYKMVDAIFRLPALVDRRIEIDARANWTDAPKVAFYGLGTDTLRSDRTNFEYRSTTVGASAQVKVLPIANVGGGLDYLGLNTGIDDFLPVSATFGPSAVSGLAANPTYTRSRAFAAIDWRDAPGYTRRGGLYRVDWSSYQERQDGPYSFTRVDGEVSQFVPLFRDNWVLAFRALASVTDADAGNQVPYALLPSLGGGNELRGFPNWRFRDRSRILLSGEYRWLAGQFVDMALFLDAGKVAPRAGDLDLNDLHTTYGIGIRFHTPAATVTRIEMAHTDEGVGFVFAFGPSF